MLMEEVSGCAIELVSTWDLTNVVYQCDLHIVGLAKYQLRVLRCSINEQVERDMKMLCEWRE